MNYLGEKMEIKIRELSAPTAFCAGSYLAQLDGERFFIQLGHNPKPEYISMAVSVAIAGRRKLQKLVKAKKVTAEICGNVRPDGSFWFDGYTPDIVYIPGYIVIGKPASGCRNEAWAYPIVENKIQGLPDSLKGFVIGKGGARIKHLSMLHGDRLVV